MLKLDKVLTDSMIDVDVNECKAAFFWAPFLLVGSLIGAKIMTATGRALSNKAAKRVFS